MYDSERNSGYDQEARFFAKKDAEAREKLRQQAEVAAQHLQDRRKIGETLGTSDDALIERLRTLGFDGETARIFDLLPLVHVAWADGSIQSKEREAIFEILKARGLERGGKAWGFVEWLLEKKPPQAFLDETLGLLRDCVAASGRPATDIVDLSIQVANATGGFLGLGGKISGEERDLIAKIAAELGGAANAEFRKQLG